MDKINFKELEHIPVPEGLEQRLAQKIDLWAMEEAAAERKRRRVVVRRRFAWLSAACVAATVAAVLCLKPQAEPAGSGAALHQGQLTAYAPVAKDTCPAEQSEADAPKAKAQRRVHRVHRTMAAAKPEQGEALPLEAEAEEPKLLAEAEVDAERQAEIDMRAERDTYADPVEAYNEANRSLAELLANVKIGKDLADNLLATK